ncbi:MAG: hypothetical protein QF738_04085, partial [Rhodospirillales bacterium]|nr:hypothetical protein [Rhodospirillales bacterium]
IGGARRSKPRRCRRDGDPYVASRRVPMSTPQIIQKMLPQFVHDYHNANTYANLVQKYHASTFDFGPQEKYRLYHEYCKSVYDGGPAPESLRPYIDSYLKDGYFAYHDEENEALCRSVFDKLEREGYVSDEVNADTSASKSHARNYLQDAYKTFPEIE